MTNASSAPITLGRGCAVFLPRGPTHGTNARRLLEVREVSIDHGRKAKVGHICARYRARFSGDHVYNPGRRVQREAARAHDAVLEVGPWTFDEELLWIFLWTKWFNKETSKSLTQRFMLLKK